MLVADLLSNSKSQEIYEVINIVELANCASCSWLLERPDTEEYRCQHGRFDKKNPRWFAPSGIAKPNETVAQAQSNCSYYQPKESFPDTRIRNTTAID